MVSRYRRLRVTSGARWYSVSNWLKRLASPAALAISAWTGRVKAASFGTAGLALAFYIFNAYLPLSDSWAGLAKWSPFYYYLTSDPLNNGMPWGHVGVLAALAAGFIVLAVVLFERRDLRQVG